MTNKKFYIFSIGAIVNPLLTNCSWYNSACSKFPLHTSAEPDLSTLMARSHDLFSLIPGMIANRQLATCSNVLKLSFKTITLASGYFAFFVFGSKTFVGDVVETVSYTHLTLPTTPYV